MFLVGLVICLIYEFFGGIVDWFCFLLVGLYLFDWDVLVYSYRVELVFGGGCFVYECFLLLLRGFYVGFLF